MSIPLQCPLPWLGNGDPVVLGHTKTRFVRNTDPSSLDENGYCLFKKAIPYEISDSVVAEVDTFRWTRGTPFFRSA